MGRQISECLPAELVSRIEEVKTKLGAGSGAATKALRPGPHNRRDEAAAAYEFVATSPTGEEGTIEPVAFASKGVPRETQKKKARASVRAKVPSPLDAHGNGSDGVANMSMVTEPHELPRSAVVIDMFAWKTAKAQRHVQNAPRARRMP